MPNNMNTVFVNIGLSIDGYLAPDGRTHGQARVQELGCQVGSDDGRDHQTVLRCSCDTHEPSVSLKYPWGSRAKCRAFSCGAEEWLASSRDDSQRHARPR